VYEDFTWDRSVTMSGAADDWAYEHLGVFAWTTEFWDVVHAATGTKQGTHFWYTGPTDAEALAVLRWTDEHAPEEYVAWYPFEHPQLGAVELGGWPYLGVWVNPPASRLKAEVAAHAEFAVAQAMAAPCLAIRHSAVSALGEDTWRVEAGVANTGWLPTYVSARAKKEQLVLPLVAELTGAAVVDGPARRQLGQLEGRAAMRFSSRSDATPDRVLVSWVVEAPAGTALDVLARHPRAGTVRRQLILEG
jgi:hypothetical protein